MLPHLEKALHDEDELVRMHVAWAIGRLGGNEAKRILLSHLEREKSDQVKEEITSALGG
jgi:epoxyqueuosine reductase